MAAAARLSVSQFGVPHYYRNSVTPYIDDEIRQFWESSEEESEGESNHHVARVLNKGGVYQMRETPATMPLESNGGHKPSSSLGRTSSFNRKIISFSGNLGITGSPKASRSSGEIIVRSSSKGGEYATWLARLRDLEKQRGVQKALDERQAGEVLAEMWLKLETLGLADMNQKDQVGRCILEAELERAHAKAKLSEWDTVGQGLKNLVKEKDTELQALRASTAEGKKHAQARAATQREVSKLRQEALSQATDNEKLVSERDQLRLALSDAEMDVQNATALVDQVKQGLSLKEGDELDPRLLRRGDSLKLQEQLRKAEEVNQQNEGLIRRLEEQLKAAKEGFVKERQVWVKDAIAQQSTIMQHIKDQEGYAKNKEKEIKKLTLSLDVARREAAEHAAETERREEEVRRQLEVRDSERVALEKRVKEQTELVTSLEEKLKGQADVVAELEGQVKERSQTIATLQKEGEKATAALLEESRTVESLRHEVERLSRKLQLFKTKENGLSKDAQAQEARVAEVTAALSEANAKAQELEQQNVGLKKQQRESEQVAEKLVAENEALSFELKAREAEVGKTKADLLSLREAAAEMESERFREANEQSERLEHEYHVLEEKLRAALSETEAALDDKIVELESRAQELSSALKDSEAARSRMEGERQAQKASPRNSADKSKLSSIGENPKTLPRALEAPKTSLRGLEETENEAPKASARGSEGLALTRKRSSSALNKLKPERSKSLPTAPGNGSEELLKVLREKEELLSRTTLDMLRQDEELRTQRREASEAAEKYESELKAAREEREKLQLRTEFLRKKVGEMKEQASQQREQAAADLLARDVKLGRLSRELDSANHEVEQLTKACRSLQTKLSHVGADVALPAGSEGSPNSRKRSRTESPGASRVSLDGWVSPDTRVSQLESELSEKEAALKGKLRELQEKEAEVKGLQEILRVLAHQLEEVDETRDQDAGRPQKSPMQSNDTAILSAMKAALKAANVPELSKATAPAPSPRTLAVVPPPKERVALKREIRELYERLEQKELDMESKLAEQTREILKDWRQREEDLVKELEGKAAKLRVMEEAFQELLGRWKEARTEAETGAANAQALDKRAQQELHSRTMLQKRLDKLEAMDKSGDGMWRELARLVAANASLEEQVEQLTGASGNPTLASSQNPSLPTPDPDQYHRRSLSLQGRPETLLPVIQSNKEFQGQGAADSESAKSSPASSPLGVEASGALKQSASGSPLASPGSDAERAQQLSQSVFDRLAVLKQRYAAEGKTPSPNTVPESLAKAPSGAAKSLGTAMESAPKNGRSATPENKEKKGTMRTLVRWFETKVPTRKSSRSNSPRESTHAVRSGPLEASRESLPTAFARNLPSLDVVPAEEEAPGALSRGPSDVQTRLEMLRQRAEASSSESGRPYEVNLRTMLERQRSGDVGSPGSTKRTEALRQEERFLGFGSPQANAIPSWLSWVPSPDVTAQEPSPAQKTRRGSDTVKGAAGRWHEAQSRAEESVAPSPSSVLERLAVLQARGSAT